MFNEAAKKFYDRFQLGNVYYISKGTLRLANKQFKTVKNDYEMTLNENSEVEEARSEEAFVPETKFNFVQIDQLGPYVSAKELVGKNPLINLLLICPLCYPFFPFYTKSSRQYIFRCYWGCSKRVSYNEHPEEKQQ